MKSQILLKNKTKKELEIRTQRLALIEKLRSMGFSEQEIEFNFFNSKKKSTSFSSKG